MNITNIWHRKDRNMAGVILLENPLGEEYGQRKRESRKSRLTPDQTGET